MLGLDIKQEDMGLTGKAEMSGTPYGASNGPADGGGGGGKPLSVKSSGWCLLEIKQ